MADVVQFNASILGARAQEALNIVRGRGGEPPSPDATTRAIQQIITLTRGNLAPSRQPDLAKHLGTVLADSRISGELAAALRAQGLLLQDLIGAGTALHLTPPSQPRQLQNLLLYLRFPIPSSKAPKLITIAWP